MAQKTRRVAVVFPRITVDCLSNIAFHLFRIPQHVLVQWGIIRLAKMEE